MKNPIIKLTALASCMAAMLFAGQTASAVVFTFVQITQNGNQLVASQLSVDVTSGSGGTVNFEFRNNVGISSSITDIYFDDGTLLAIASITDSGVGVAFTQGANPGNLPGGNNVNPDFNTTARFSLDSDTPITANGINSASEYVTVNFTLQGSQTFADTIASLLDGTLRIGLHVQAIGIRGGSESFVHQGGGDVSIPDGGTTLILLGSALTSLGLLRRKFGVSIG